MNCWRGFLSEVSMNSEGLPDEVIPFLRSLFRIYSNEITDNDIVKLCFNRYGFVGPFSLIESPIRGNMTGHPPITDRTRLIQWTLINARRSTFWEKSFGLNLRKDIIPELLCVVLSLIGVIHGSDERYNSIVQTDKSWLLFDDDCIVATDITKADDPVLQVILRSRLHPIIRAFDFSKCCVRVVIIIWWNSWRDQILNIFRYVCIMRWRHFRFPIFVPRLIHSSIRFQL
jgi:hypothetical protein